MLKGLQVSPGTQKKLLRGTTRVGAAPLPCRPVRAYGRYSPVRKYIAWTYTPWLKYDLGAAAVDTVPCDWVWKDVMSLIRLHRYSDWMLRGPRFMKNSGTAMNWWWPLRTAR